MDIVRGVIKHEQSTIDDYPILVLPSLATEIGLNEAIVLTNALLVKEK